MTFGLRPPGQHPLCGPGGDLGAGAEIELVEDVLDVRIDRALADMQPVRYIPIGETLGDEGRDLAFAVGQGGRDLPASPGPDGRDAQRLGNRGFDREGLAGGAGRRQLPTRYFTAQAFETPRMPLLLVRRADRSDLPSKGFARSEEPGRAF
jgi:hypothetical protein